MCFRYIQIYTGRFTDEKVEDVRAAVEIANKKKHSPARKYFGASSIFLLAFV